MLFRSGIKQNKLSDILGKINVVMFSPDDIEILKSGPAKRRRFLNIMISQLRPKYMYNLNMYIKAVEQRNNYLRQIDLENKNKELLDVWDEKVAEYEEKGYTIIIVGRRDHPEVVGINGWCNNKAIIVENIDEAEAVRARENICIVSQTTNRQDFFDDLVEIIAGNNKNVLVFNTICQATSQRQNACIKLAKTVEAMVVIDRKSVV